MVSTGGNAWILAYAVAALQYPTYRTLYFKPIMPKGAMEQRGSGAQAKNLER